MVRTIASLIRRAVVLLIYCLGCLPVYSVAAGPKIVVSIAPIHSLVANVMQGVGEPELLVQGSQSPHHFSLTPSQIQKVKEADLIIWVGDVLESFLVKPIQSFDKHSCRLIESPHLYLLRLRGKSCGDSCQNMAMIDPHIWLDIDNAIVMVDHISHCLSEIDRKNRSTYHQNAMRVKEKLTHLREEVLQQAQVLEGLKFICVHDAFRYYEKMVGIHNIGVLASSHSLEPSLKHLSELKTLIQKGEVRCVFSEPQSQSPILNNLTKEFNLYSGIIDPLGASIEPGQDQYFLLLKNITNAFINCLKYKHDS